MFQGTMETQFHNALLIHNPNAGVGGHARRRLIEQARRILSAVKSWSY